MHQTRWVERTFNFDFPVGLFPCILERVRGTPARLEELVQSLPAVILTTRLTNAWSIQVHVGHLTDLDELHDGRLDDYNAGAVVLRPADMTNAKTEKANHNARGITDLLASFRSTRGAFVRRLEGLEEATLSRRALHPRMQEQMRLVDMLYFIAEHDDHHLARISALARILADS